MWKVAGNDRLEVATVLIKLTCNWESSAVLMDDGRKMGFLEVNIVESEVMWLQ